MNKSHTSPTKLSLHSLRIDAKKLSLKSKTYNKSLSKSSYNNRKPSSYHHLPRPKSASISTFSTRRIDTQQRPKTAPRKRSINHNNDYHLKSKTELLNETLHHLYPTKAELIPNKYRPDDISRAVRLHTQYQKTLQKRSRYINKIRKPKFSSLSKNISCYNAKIKCGQEMLLYESPYHSMNVDHFEHRPLKKVLIPWDLRMYNKTKSVDHMATRTQTVTINTTESYKRVNAMMNNMYRPSVKDFFGKEYDLKTGLDPKYVFQKQHHKRPIYV